MKPLLISLLFFLPYTSLVAQYDLDLYVASDGTAEYAKIQDAIDATKAFPSSRITIHIKAGVYQEKVKVHAWNNLLTLRGAGAETTVIRWDDHFEGIDRGRNSTFHTPTLLVQGDDFLAEGLTIENFAGPVGQAVALSVEADRARIVDCRLLGNQDTLYAAGVNSRQLYKNCYIEGTTDFIFGPATAYFENCTIHSKADSYITAASTPAHVSYGFVFSNCTLTAAQGVSKVYLGRPWRDFARTVFLDSDLGSHIAPEGWQNWGEESKKKTTLYGEYGNRGEGAGTSDRVNWSRQLNKREAKKYTRVRVLSAITPAPMTF